MTERTRADLERRLANRAPSNIEPEDWSFAAVAVDFLASIQMRDRSATTELFDDFDTYQVYVEAETPWVLNKGSDGACADPVIASAKGGIVRLVSAAAAAETVATDGCQIVGKNPWSADMGGLIFEARLRIAAAVTNVQICVGLTDITTLEMPASVAAAAITTNFSDGCVFCYDVAATTDQWYCVGVAADWDAAGNGITDVVPTAAVYQVLRIEIDDHDNARFYIDGSLVKTLTANAVTIATSLYPTVVVTGNSAAKTVDVDYILVRAGRAG
jgi:hypothetical protein